MIPGLALIGISFESHFGLIPLSLALICLLALASLGEWRFFRFNSASLIVQGIICSVIWGFLIALIGAATNIHE